MQKDERGALLFSPSDLVRFVESPYASFMDRCYLEDRASLTPDERDPLIEILAGKGLAHEARFRTSLEEQGQDVAEIDDREDAFEQTKQALVERREVVFQARLKHAPFAGYADFLLRSEDADAACPYEVWDTKLAASVKPYYLVQLCCYAEMLEAMIGTRPEKIGVVLGPGEKVAYRTDDFFYYYLGIKRAFLDAMAAFDPRRVPPPDPRADHGRWSSHAQQHLEAVDHLVRVAGISHSQIRKLEAASIGTLTELATTTTQRVPKLDPLMLERLREQAALQLASASRDRPAYRVLVPEPDEPRQGLALLPPPSPMDVYFDMEGDPLVEGGLEYLFGATHIEDGQPQFWDAWAFDPAGEKAAFERFVDWVIERWTQDRSMHVYHYAAYEESALKRLMGRYATREEEVDNLLRHDVLVDLYRVVRQGLRIGTPGYSLKDVETLYMTREGEVESGGESIVEFERFLASDEPNDWQASPILRSLRDYNRVDCDSTWQLAQWLRARKAESRIAWIPPGGDTEREVHELGDEMRARRDLATALIEAGEPDTTNSEHEREISQMLGYLLEFHRREDKPVWWSFFARHEMTPEQLVDDTTCIGNATLESGPVPIRRSQGFWYRFDPDQETKIRERKRVHIAGQYEVSLGVEEFDPEGRVLVVIGDTARGRLPDGMPDRASFLPDEHVSSKTIEQNIGRVAQAWSETRTLPEALPNLFRREPPLITGHADGPLIQEDEDVLEGTCRVIVGMQGGTLCIQGPPGSGKTYTASHAIQRLLNAGKDVGVVSNSHEAVFNVLAAVNDRYSGNLDCLKVGGNGEHTFFDKCPNARFQKGGGDGANAYAGGLVGGTAWLYSREDMQNRLDYLFVDEAGQISLANLVGMAPCAKNLVLLGDQMQLPQPLQGTHPGESGTSALEYALAGHLTVPDELGIFLPETYRLHPDICEFTSGAFYESRLGPVGHTKQRVVRVPADPSGVPIESGILFCGVPHEGNAQASDEEVEAIVRITQDLLGREITDEQGVVTKRLDLHDILFVAPFNMQVRRLRRALPAGAKVASVDKFQGQQAPVVIVSLCRSAGGAETSARGLEFVLDPNRLNVAVSRAQSLVVVVGDARLTLSPPRSVASMQRMNLLARLHTGHTEPEQIPSSSDCPCPRGTRAAFPRIDGEPHWRCAGRCLLLGEICSGSVLTQAIAPSSCSTACRPRIIQGFR